MAQSEFINKVYDYCTGKGLLVGVSCIVAGLSGGPDSVALVTVLARLRDEVEGFPKLYAVHVNHGLRDTANLDEELSSKLCGKLNVPFVKYSFDVKEEAAKLGRGLEDTGRILRYKAFDEAAVKASGELNIRRSEVKIATAHHSDDLAETFMMNLFRGSGLDGLTAMSSNDNVIRPLMGVTKDEIVKYLDDGKIEYATDETNLETDYTRNKWRNDIFPKIAEASVKDPKDAISDTYRLLSIDGDYLQQVAGNRYKECLVKSGDVKFIRIADIKDLHEAIRTRVIRLYWEEVFGNLTDFESKHVDIVSELIRIQGGTHYADLSFGRRSMSVEGYLGFCEKDGVTKLACAISTYIGFPAVPDDFSLHISMKDIEDGPKTYELPGSKVLVRASVVENSEGIVYNMCSWICPEEVLDIGVIPCEGTFQKAGSPHKADIKKLLSDMKVPRDARSHLIAVSAEGRLLWIPGIGHSEGFVSSKSREAWLNKSPLSYKEKLIKLDIVG